MSEQTSRRGGLTWLCSGLSGAGTNAGSGAAPGSTSNFGESSSELELASDFGSSFGSADLAGAWAVLVTGSEVVTPGVRAGGEDEVFSFNLNGPTNENFEVRSILTNPPIKRVSRPCCHPQSLVQALLVTLSHHLSRDLDK